MNCMIQSWRRGLLNILKQVLLRRRLRNAQDSLVLIFDVDGVLTDGSFYYSAEGKLFKKFGPHDSEAANLLSKSFEIRFISADHRGFQITKKRIQDMGFSLELIPASQRVKYIREFQRSGNSVFFIADAPSDVPALLISDFSACPRNVLSAVASCVDVVLDVEGGRGVVAEVLNFLSKSLGESSKHA